MYMCPIPNGFRDRAISLYSSKIVDKKDKLPTVSNTGIYCSSDKVSSKSPPATLVCFTTRVETWTCCSSVVYSVLYGSVNTLPRKQ
jgi:hypothetical protein